MGNQGNERRMLNDSPSFSFLYTRLHEHNTQQAPSSSITALLNSLNHPPPVSLIDNSCQTQCSAADSSREKSWAFIKEKPTGTRGWRGMSRGNFTWTLQTTYSHSDDSYACVHKPLIISIIPTSQFQIIHLVQHRSHHILFPLFHLFHFNMS